MKNKTGIVVIRYITEKAKAAAFLLKPFFMSEEKEMEGATGAGPVADDAMTPPVPAIGGPSPESGPDVPKTTASGIVSAVVNGAGVGLLLGTLLGLSISPVVSGVIGTLSGLLAVLLGTSEKYMSRLKSVRIGAFGFFCVAGILLGMHVRINNALLPDRKTMMNEYRRVGFSKQEALDFIAFREFGIVPAGWKGGNNPAAQVSDGVPPTSNAVAEPDMEGKPAQSSSQPVRPAGIVQPSRVFANDNATGAERQSVLYSAEVEGSGCYFLKLADSAQELSELKDKFDRAGGTWQEMAAGLEPVLPHKIYVRSLLILRDCFCKEAGSGTYKVEMNAKTRALNTNNSPEEIRNTLLKTGGIWTLIVNRVDAGIPLEYQKTLYLKLLTIFKT